MDDLVRELEEGTLVPPTERAPVVAWVRSAVVAREWAAAQRLRPGNTVGPPSRALVPVVGAWAEERGLTGPAHRELGRGLLWAGLRRRTRGEHGEAHLALHRDDAQRLWALVREAWAPGLAPGDPRGRPRRPRRRVRPPHKPHPTPPRPFHEVLAALGKRARPLVDSLGRVWPTPVVAARALGGNSKALGNSVAWLAAALAGGPSTDARALRAALARGAAWHGVWWRYLTPAEVAAVPPNHLVGLPLPGLGWGLTCPRCGAHPTTQP